MRCLTLAAALRERGAECRFVCREDPGNLLELIRRQGFEAIPLPIDNGQDIDWHTDAAQTKVGVGETAADWLVVDHYALDARWEQMLRPHCHKLMVVDDLANRPHECDLLLDQNLVGNMRGRYEGKVPAGCCRLLGPDYALLQPTYARLHDGVMARSFRVRRMLIYFGGADTDNLTGMAMDAFISLGQQEVALDVVINPASPHAESIRQKSSGQPLITVHGNLPSLAPLMVQADLAIGAGGATSWERCCLGLPTLVITLAENQKPVAVELNRRGLIRWLGHRGEVDSAGLAATLHDCLESGLAPGWSKRCRELVDGRGAVRVTDIMTCGSETQLHARLAQADDEATLLCWANDPQVRQNSFSIGEIDAATHHTWFSKRLHDRDHCHLYVIETVTGLPVGQVRFEQTDQAWEIHYTIDPCFRGRGMGKTFLETALRAFAASVPMRSEIFGRVKPENTASRKIFDSLGFDGKITDTGLICYRSIS